MSGEPLLQLRVRHPFHNVLGAQHEDFLARPVGIVIDEARYLGETSARLWPRQIEPEDKLAQNAVMGVRAQLEGRSPALVIDIRKNFRGKTRFGGADTVGLARITGIERKGEGQENDPEQDKASQQGDL